MVELFGRLKKGPDTEEEGLGGMDAIRLTSLICKVIGIKEKEKEEPGLNSKQQS